MNESSKITDELEIDPGYCQLANQHEATYLSVMGSHTPGVNSDSMFLNKVEEGEKSETRFPRLLALVDDGVSGSVDYRSLALGKQAADYFSKELPKFWNRQYDRGSRIEFSELIFRPNSPTKSIIEVYYWLIEHMDRCGISTDLQKAKRIMLAHTDLLMRDESEIPLEQLSGKTAKEIAGAILIDDERLAATLRLLMALYSSIIDYNATFQRKFRKKKIKDGKFFYSATTTTGVIDLPNEYMLFSVGDSGGFMVDDTDIIDNSVARCPTVGKITSAIGCGFVDSNRQVELLLPTNSIDEVDNKKFLSKGIEIKFIEKKDVKGKDYALVLLTDGLMQTPDWLDAISGSVSKEIGDTRKTIRTVYGKALQLDLELKSKRLRYRPDDKTMVIIKKCQA